jgi:hypothetical protein
MNQIVCVVLLCVFQSVVLHAANSPMTRKMHLGIPVNGQYTDTVFEHYAWTVVGATITYTITEGSEETKSSSIQGTFSSTASAILAFATQTGISAQRCQSAVLNSAWILTSTTQGKRAGVDSMTGFANRQNFPFWIFDRWIIGPPPTDKLVQTTNKETIDAGSPPTKTKEIDMTYEWYLEWMEVHTDY